MNEGTWGLLWIKVRLSISASSMTSDPLLTEEKRSLPIKVAKLAQLESASALRRRGPV